MKKGKFLVTCLISIILIFAFVSCGGSSGGGGGGKNNNKPPSSGYHSKIITEHSMVEGVEIYDFKGLLLDSSKKASNVTFSGPGITGSVNCTYDTQYGEWSSDWIDYTGDPPANGSTYTFTVTDAEGTHDVTAKLGPWIAVTTCVQPSEGATVSNPVTVSWNAVSQPNVTYWVSGGDCSDCTTKSTTCNITCSIGQDIWVWLDVTDTAVWDDYQNRSEQECGPFNVE